MGRGERNNRFTGKADAYAQAAVLLRAEIEKLSGELTRLQTQPQTKRVCVEAVVDPFMGPAARMAVAS